MFHLKRFNWILVLAISAATAYGAPSVPYIGIGARHQETRILPR